MSTPDPGDGRSAEAARGIPLVVVGIGASAGGLEACARMLRRLPSDTGLAYVVVQHLDPTHASALAPRLGGATRMPVAQGVDGERVLPDHVYVIPPGAETTIRHGRLWLSPRTDALAVIDHFFRSLAAEQGHAAVGVVLYGTGADGTQGLADLRAAGAITICQDDSARSSEMPDHAVRSAACDLVLSPEELASQLIRIASHPYLRRSEADSGAPREDESHAEILDLIRRELGVDFAPYRQVPVRLRIRRRMVIGGVKRMSEYHWRLSTDRSEMLALYEDLLARVTGFFRDPAVFGVLAAEVFPAILRSKAAADPVRIWVPACSSGQEAYAMAMAAVEAAGDTQPRRRVQVFGTDLAAGDWLARARDGVYPDAIEGDVSPERLRRFFVREGGRHRVSQAIRDLCVFARHDVSTDPPLPRMDLVCGRNLLASLSPELRDGAISALHAALEPHGFLLLGPSDTLGVGGSDRFDTVDAAHRIWSKRAPVRRSAARAASMGPQDGLALAASAPAPPAHGALDGVPPAAGGTWARLVGFWHAWRPSRRTQHDELGRLRIELDSMRSYLAAVIVTRDDDASRVAKEAGATTDDLQSTNEELQTAKEELQSTNEELITINDEMIGRNSALHRANDDLVNLLGSANVPLVVVGADLLVRRFTPEAARLFGLLPRDLGRPVTPALLHLVPDLAIRVGESIDRARVDELEVQDGGGRWYQVRIHPYRMADDTIDGAVVVVADVSGAKALESKLRRAGDFANAVIESVPEGLLVLDGDLKVKSANTACAATIGCLPDEMLGRSLAEIGPAWANAELDRLVRRLLSEGTAFEGFALWAGDGAPHLLVHGRVIDLGDEAEGRVLLVAQDVTAHHRLAEHLQEHADVLTAQDRHRKEFVATLAHELRNPLSPVRTGLDVFRRTDLSAHPALTGLVDLMGRHLDQAVHLIDDLLDVSRIERGVVAVDLQEVDLLASLRDAVDACRPGIEAAGHELTVLLPETPMVVTGDPIRLCQIFENLLANATRYTPPGGRIWLEATPGTLGARGAAVVRVRDNGVGIHPAQLERIFDLFEAGPALEGQRKEGLGIGLHIVFSLVGLHEGTVEARSAGLGLGSEFVVTLPLSPPTVAATPRRRVLVVDDDDAIRESMCVLLRMDGYEVESAGDGVTALQVAARFDPEAVLLDLGLPGMDGHEIARRLRAEVGLTGALLVAISGYGTQEDRTRTKASGFDAHLVKPANIEDIEALLERA